MIQDFLSELSGPELERLAVAVVREYRVRLQRAQDLFEEIGRRDVARTPDDEVEEQQHAYSVAMLNLHVQHDLVSRVQETLGHLPIVDGQQVVLN